MGIRCKTPIQEIERKLRQEAERLHRKVLRLLRYVGEQSVKIAKDRAPELSWIDHSGNLRSSIGYVVAYDGAIDTLGGFGGGEGQAQGQGKAEAQGASVGRALAEELAEATKGKYALIVVAGMHYAQYVEALEHKDVLATPELKARKIAQRLFERLQSEQAKQRKP